MDSGALRTTLALASAYKEGDLAIGGTTDERLRDEARAALLATTVGEITDIALVDDQVTDALSRSRLRRFDSELRPLTIARLRATLVSPGAPSWLRTYGHALGSEAIAAVVKVMTTDELSTVARAVFHPLGDDPIAIGGANHFGSRIQPNSAGDDEREILFSIFEGLAHGCGDVIIGLNPAADDVDAIVRLEQLLEQVVRRLELPTRFCVLSDIVKQHAAQRRTRVDVGFQSLAGTSHAITGMVGLDVDGIAELAQTFDGLYFETGQGSEVTNGAAAGVDMGTLEARTYGVARHIVQRTGRWTIVNDVAGFIGPEVFRTAEQLERVCLEDVVMAKLHGLTMGLDVCATFHMGIAPDTLRTLTRQVVARGAPAYLMSVAGNADPMLGYLTTSYREHPGLRRHAGKGTTSAMSQRLEALGVGDRRGDGARDPAVLPGADAVSRLSAAYHLAGGDRRSQASLEEDARRQIAELRERGLDLGVTDSSQANARVEAIYANARSALYATLADAVLRDATMHPMLVRTTASSRDEYLASPSSGERLRADDARAVGARYADRAPQVQLVISDGLNANAINEQLRGLLPGVRRALAAGGHHVGDSDVVVQNGRVRVGYEIGELTRADIVVHVIGERPGTGLNTLSLYVTYGRDQAGRVRWSRELPHSATTAICSVHPKGKPADAAIAELTTVVGRMVRSQRSGVALDS